MSLVSRWSVWVGWLSVCASLALGGGALSSFVHDVRRVLGETQSRGYDERLSDVRPEQETWLVEQKGGQWGRYGWYLEPGQEGSLRATLPGVQPGILKLRVWAFTPGHLEVVVRDGTISFEIPSRDLDGQPLQFLVHGQAELTVMAASNLSQEQLVLDRFAAAWFPPDAQLPWVWSFVCVVSLGVGGGAMWAYQHRSLYRNRSIWLGCTGILIAAFVGFALRWTFFDIVRGLPLAPDAAEYLSHARSLNWFTSDHGFYSGTFSEREPLHVGALSLWFRLLGDNGPAMILYTVCLSTLLIIVSGLFMWGLTEKWLFGVLASWMVAISPAWIDESVRGLRLESLSLLLLAVLGVWVWARGWLGALVLGALAGSMALIQSPAFGIVLPLVWLAWLLNLWRARHGLVLLWPSQWRWLHLVVVSLVSVLMFSPHLYGLYKVHGDLSWPSYGYARWNANVEFQDRLGTTGFPSVEEFQKTPYAGPRVTYGDYLFGMHSIPKLLYGHIKGWVESSVYMSVSHMPQVKDLIFLHHASGFQAVFRHLTAVTVIVFILSLCLTALGWADLWRRPEYWWVPFLSLWGTWYTAYLYSVRLVEPFRHTGHVYPLLLFCLLWGCFQAYQWLRAFLFDRADPSSALHEAKPVKQEQA